VTAGLGFDNNIHCQLFTDSSTWRAAYSKWQPGTVAVLTSGLCYKNPKTEQGRSFEVKAKAIQCVKGKASPLQAWTGPEGSRSFRLPDFKTIGT